MPPIQQTPAPTVSHSLDGYKYVLPALAPSPSGGLAESVRAVKLASFSPFLAFFGALQKVGDLLISPKFSSQLGAVVTPCFCRGPDRYFCQHRRILLSQIKSTDVVLDVGSGDGVYLPYLRNAGKIISMEPNTVFHSKIREHAQSIGIPHDKLVVSGHTLEEYHEKNPAQQFDWIVLGNVMCEVKDPSAVLECLDKMLRDPLSTPTRGIASVNQGGGKLFFSEHIGSPKGSLLRCVQNLINPVWKFGLGRCNVNRDTAALIEARPNWKSFHVEATFANIQWAIGLAMKQGGTAKNDT